MFRRVSPASLHEVRPNSGAPAEPAALQWVVHHQSPLPWVNSVMLWPAPEKPKA